MDSNQCVGYLMRPHAPNNLLFGKYWGDNINPDLQTSSDACKFWYAISQEISSILHATIAIETEIHVPSDLDTEKLALNYEL